MILATTIAIHLAVCPAAVVNDAPRHSYAFQTCYMVGAKAAGGIALMTVAEGVAKIKAARKMAARPKNETRFGITPKCRLGALWNLATKHYRCVRRK